MFVNTDKLVYKGHWREPENVPFMSSCPWYSGSNYIHYSLNRENETTVICYIEVPFKTGLNVVDFNFVHNFTSVGVKTIVCSDDFQFCCSAGKWVSDYWW